VDDLPGRRPSCDAARAGAGLVALLALWAVSGLVKDEGTPAVGEPNRPAATAAARATSR
jgi:hypothetical protein